MTASPPAPFRLPRIACPAGKLVLLGSSYVMDCTEDTRDSLERAQRAAEERGDSAPADYWQEGYLRGRADGRVLVELAPGPAAPGDAAGQGGADCACHDHALGRAEQVRDWALDTALSGPAYFGRDAATLTEETAGVVVRVAHMLASYRLAGTVPGDGP